MTIYDKAKNVYETMGAHVSLSILPTWAKGVEVSYQSPNFAVERLPGYITNNNPATTTGQVVPVERLAPATAGAVRDSAILCTITQLIMSESIAHCRSSATIQVAPTGIYYDTEKDWQNWPMKHFFYYRPFTEDN